MLSEDKIIALYCIVDDILKAMRHQEDRECGSVIVKSLLLPL